MTLRIASRGSTLALWQARHVAALLEHHAGVHSDIDVVRTQGDRIADVPLARIGDRGLFTKEIDDAVLDGRADIAVHSCKDIPTRLATGLEIIAVIERDDPRDAFVPRPQGAVLETLPAGARVGTSSLRRQALLRATYTHVAVEDARGNLDTRLRKLDAGAWDGIIVAVAGLRRIGAESRVSAVLDTPAWLPAAGQGALAIVARADNVRAHDCVALFDHADTRTAIEAERSFLGTLEGGCQVPIGALGIVDDGHIVLNGLIASLDGTVVIRDETRGPATDARAVGVRLAGLLLDAGAGDILSAVRSHDIDTHPAPAP